jgi:putative protease
MTLARELLPDVPLHVSTQANTANSRAVNAWRDLGASRVVLARELSLDEVKRIRGATDVSLEVFVHGAMCMALSGRCLLSSYFTSPVYTIGGKRHGVRDANRGDCVQSCRWNFALSESERPGEYFPVEETPKGTTILSSKDLCLAHRMRELTAAGIDAFKIEGRMKGVYYVSNVTRVYRRALDDALTGRDTPPEILAELEQVSHREYATGFLFGEASALEPHLRGAYIRDRLWIGTVRGDAGPGRTKILTANRLRKGDRLEAIRPDGTNLAIPEFRIYREGVEVEMSGHDAEVELEFPGAETLREYDILRGEIAES